MFCQPWHFLLLKKMIGDGMSTCYNPMSDRNIIWHKVSNLFVSRLLDTWQSISIVACSLCTIFCSIKFQTCHNHSKKSLRNTSQHLIDCALLLHRSAHWWFSHGRKGEFFFFFFGKFEKEYFVFSIYVIMMTWQQICIIHQYKKNIESMCKWRLLMWLNEDF